MKDLKEISVEIGIPKVFSIRGTIIPSKEDKEAAWELYIELITRVTIVELEEGKGILREALNSFHSLFDTTRKIIREKGSGLAKTSDKSKICLGLIAISMLNYVLRPFLTEWHPVLLDYESQKPTNISQKAHEEKWDKNFEIRSKMKELRETLNHYAHLLASIAEVDPIHNIPLIK